MKLETSSPSLREVRGGGRQLRFRKETGKVDEVEAVALEVAALDVAAAPLIVFRCSLCDSEPVTLSPIITAGLPLR